MGFDANALFDYEAGLLDDAATVRLFSDLVRSGVAWTLQGHYGRVAANMIKNGLIDASGNILIDLDSI